MSVLVRKGLELTCTWVGTVFPCSHATLPLALLGSTKKDKSEKLDANYKQNSIFSSQNIFVIKKVYHKSIFSFFGTK